MDLFLRQRTGVNLTLNNKLVTSFVESVAALVFWRYEDEPESEPKFLGETAAGTTLKVPFDFSPGRAIRLFLVSKTATGDQTALRSVEGVQLVFNPNIETATPVIGQLTAATNTQVSIWVNNFTEKAKYRKIVVSPNSDMSSPDLTEYQAASDFGVNNLLPNEVLITKTGVSGTVTKYIQVSHSSNDVEYGTASNILSVTFANSGGTGGSGGGDPPCFIGLTQFKFFDRSSVSFSTLYENKDQYIGKPCALSFDENNERQKGIIEEVFRHEVFEYLEVKFNDGSVMGVTKEHPYFTENFEYIAVGKLNKGDLVFNDSMRKVKILNIQKIEVPEGIYVYNARIRQYQNYVADNKRVHNAKEVEL